ncbi:hypothetical protein C0J52_01425 [Blattella germanica]|nr:hypothetical protein C0J52_01425 [Blattella germanica]
MDPIARSLLVCVALLVLSLPLIRPQALETDPDIYEITSQILNLTQHSIELGSNVSTTAFNASVLFGCQAASLFLDKGLWGAIQALLKGDGETYPEMQQVCYCFSTSD